MSNEEWEQLSKVFGPGVEPLDAQYRYSTHRPRADHARFTDLPGHHLGWRSRKNLITGVIAYRARCMCGDEQSEWVRPKKRIERWHEAHLAVVERQQLKL